MRAIRARYNPYLQTRHRVEQLAQLGHSVDKVYVLGLLSLRNCSKHHALAPSSTKVEFIVMGGTFMALDVEYRDYFISNLHDALSGHTSTCVAEAVRCVSQCSYLILNILLSFPPPDTLNDLEPNVLGSQSKLDLIIVYVHT